MTRGRKAFANYRSEDRSVAREERGRRGRRFYIYASRASVPLFYCVSLLRRSRYRRGEPRDAMLSTEIRYALRNRREFKEPRETQVDNVNKGMTEMPISNI